MKITKEMMDLAFEPLYNDMTMRCQTCGWPLVSNRFNRTESDDEEGVFYGIKVCPRCKNDNEFITGSTDHEER